MALVHAERVEHLEQALMASQSAARAKDPVSGLTQLPDSVIMRMGNVVLLDPVLADRLRAMKKKAAYDLSLRRETERDLKEHEKEGKDPGILVMMALKEEAYNNFRSTYRDIQELLATKQRRVATRLLTAQLALSEVRDQAIKLSDGRRVYFRGNGEALDESGLVLQGKDLDEAREKKQQKQDAATYEAYRHADGQYREAVREKTKLDEYWQKWRDLNEDVEAGNIGTDELKRRQAELLNGLDPKDREQIFHAHPERRDLYEQFYKTPEGGRAFASEALPEEPGAATTEDRMAAAASSGMQNTLDELDGALDEAPVKGGPVITASQPGIVGLSI